MPPATAGPVPRPPGTDDPGTDDPGTDDPGTAPRRRNRPGGDVEVTVARDGHHVRVRGTWRRLGLRVLWAAPLLGIELAVLVTVWWQLPALRPGVLAAGLLLGARHLRRGVRELRGVLDGWLELDDTGVRGLAIGPSLAWSDVREVRLSGDPGRPRIGYVLAEGSEAGRRRRPPWPAGVRRTTPTVGPDIVPTERLLDVLVPVDAVVALGDADADPIEVRVVEEGFHVRPARGRPVSMRWDALHAVEVTAVPAGAGRLACSVDLLGEVRLPGAPRTREELVSLPLTLARSSGLVEELRRLDPALPDRLQDAEPGTHELWSR
jgi:hypothetical protein